MSSKTPPRVHLLSPETRQKLGVGPAITSINNVVEELVELPKMVVLCMLDSLSQNNRNSLDACASVIHVTLVDSGLSSIVVSDNGVGISERDLVLVGQRGYTSKLLVYTDLSKVSSFGFRGEALNSICACATKVTISTRAANDATGTIMTLDRSGHITSKLRAAHQLGTRITVSNALSAFPVRQEKSRNQTSLINRYITQFMQRIHIANPSVRLILDFVKGQVSDVKKPKGKSDTHVWPGMSSLSLAVKAMIGNVLFRSTLFIGSSIVYQDLCQKGPQERIIKYQAIIPKLNLDLYSGFLKHSGITLVINNRPVSAYDNNTKAIREKLQGLYPKMISKKFLFAIIHVHIDPDLIDVNFESRKDHVLFRDEVIFEDMLSDLIFKAKSSVSRITITSSDSNSCLSCNSSDINVDAQDDGGSKSQDQSKHPNTITTATSVPIERDIWRSNMDDSDDDSDGVSLDTISTPRDTKSSSTNKLPHPKVSKIPQQIAKVNNIKSKQSNAVGSNTNDSITKRARISNKVPIVDCQDLVNHKHYSKAPSIFLAKYKSMRVRSLNRVEISQQDAEVLRCCALECKNLKPFVLKHFGSIQ